MKHPVTVSGFGGTSAELAEQIGNLQYDTLAELLDLLAQKVAKDADKDQGRGRVKLAQELSNCSNHLAVAAHHISKAWQICEPYVEP
ncbi:MAG: hypothetical protein ACFB0C_04245 [Leptolyngbyaceae cyanobacterium]